MHTLCKHKKEGPECKIHLTSLGKSLRSHILEKRMRVLALFLDVLNSLIVPFLFAVRDVCPEYTDGNAGREDDNTLDVSTERFRISSVDGR